MDLELNQVKQAIEAITECLKQGGKLVGKMQEFSEKLLTAAEKTLKVLEEMRNEEIKRISQVKHALHDLVLVAEKAIAFFDKVDDVIWYCSGTSMTAAREEIRFYVDLQLAGGLG